MRVSIVTCAAALVLAITQSGQGQAATFDFSFSNTFGDVSGTVTGEILGLADTGTSAATDVIVTSAPAGVGFTSFPVDIFKNLLWTTFNNSFTVTAGQITGAEFLSEAGPGSVAPHLLLNYGSINALNNVDGQFGVVNIDGLAGVTFTPVATPVPEPSTWAMMALGFAGIGFMGWRGSRKTVANAA